MLLGALLILIGPSLLSWGERRAYQADRALLQGAVEKYRETTSALRPWPTLSGRVGEPSVGAVEGFQCDQSDGAELCSWIDVEALAAAGLLRNAEAINSADSTRNVTASNAPSGSYGWYIDARGQVQSQPPFNPATGYP